MPFNKISLEICNLNLFCPSHLLYNLHLVNVAAQAVGRACVS